MQLGCGSIVTLITADDAQHPPPRELAHVDDHEQSGRQRKIQLLPLEYKDIVHEIRLRR